MVNLLHGQRPVKQAVACGPKAHIQLHTRLSPVMPGEGLDCSSAAVWKHALEGADAKKIAAVLGVSLAYVYRHIRNVAGGQGAWRRHDFTLSYAQDARLSRLIIVFTKHMHAGGMRGCIATIGSGFRSQL
jgi:hypothetical protein